MLSSLLSKFAVHRASMCRTRLHAAVTIRLARVRRPRIPRMMTMLRPGSRLESPARSQLWLSLCRLSTAECSRSYDREKEAHTKD